MFGGMVNIIDEAVLQAKKNGNDAVIIKNLSDRKDWGNYDPTTHIAVFEPNKLLTKSQLTDIWNKAVGGGEIFKSTSASIPKKYELNVTTEEAKSLIGKMFSPEEVKVFFDPTLVERRSALGLFKGGKVNTITGVRSNSIIKLYESGGMVSDAVAYHESFHAFFNEFTTADERKIITDKIKKSKIAFKKSYDKTVYKTPEARAQEWMADDFARYMKAPKQYKGMFSELWGRFVEKIRDIIRRINKVDGLYKDIVNKRRIPNAEPVDTTSLKFMPDSLERKQINDLTQQIQDIYKNTGDSSEPGFTRAQEVMSKIMTDLELAAPGKRFQMENGEFSGYASTFPEWIPPELRKRALLDKVLQGLDPNNIVVPTALRQRELFNAVMNMADQEIGVDTKALRAKIDSIYEKPTTITNSSATGSTGNRPKSEVAQMNVQENVPELKSFDVENQSILEQETLLQELNKLEGTHSPSIAQGDIKPFDKMVHDLNTPVKQKVNILDHVRTPDRVLKKIGLENVGKEIRKGYEAYLKELPTHLETISDWRKQTTQEENVNIFRYLDGQNVTISNKEKKIAGEIRQYLDDWALRLGLPEGEKISHYITHIFEIGAKQKEFDEDVAKIIKDKIPGSVYDPFLEERLGAKGYVEDTWRALDAYVKRGTRKANMDPALEQLERASKGLELSQYNYVKRFADKVNMRPSEVDNLLDNQMKQMFGYRFGQRPVALLSRVARQMVYRAFLGLNVGSAVKNLTQGVNTFSKLGTKYTTIGYTNLLTKMGNKELVEQGILSQDMIQDKTISALGKTVENMDKGLFFMFEMAEKINRGSAYWGAKAKALDQGATEEQAIEYAKKLVRDTQFVFGSIDMPVAMNNDIVKIITQFMSFGVKQTEFLTEMVKNKEWAGLIRYIAAAFVIVYGLGKTFNIKATDFIPVTALAKFGTPPVFALPKEIYGSLTDARGYFGQKRDAKTKIMDVVKAVPFPASIQIQKTIGGVSTYNNPKANIVKGPAVFGKAALLGKQNLPVASTPADSVKNLLKKYNIGSVDKAGEILKKYGL
jgi:hypothetical protein